jgi:hypothetical protein
MSTTQESKSKTKVNTITVNTRPHEWVEKTITFEQVVALAFPGQDYDPDGTTVEFTRGEGKDKSLRPNEHTNVKDGMIFDVESAIRS